MAWRGNRRSSTALAEGSPVAASLCGLAPGLQPYCQAEEPGRAKQAAAGP